MSKKVPHKHAEIIKAWADGVKVQWAHPSFTSKWVDVSTPSFSEALLYRIKPEPKTPGQILYESFGGNWEWRDNEAKQVYETAAQAVIEHMKTLEN